MAPGAQDTGLRCHRCSKFFKLPATLKAHVQVCFQSNAELRFQCEVCTKRFRTQIQFTRHSYYAHSQRTLVCPESACGRVCYSQSHLKNHMITHTTDRPHPCPFPGCSYRARTAGRLEQHKVVHGEGRRFPCDYCDYSATTSSNLRRHSRIHAGARPYRCPHCGHRTYSLDALKKHVLDSGRHPGLPLYLCPWCPGPDGTTSRSVCVGFNASNLAWRHFLTEHAEELTSSDIFKRVSNSTKKILLEREVTRLLGIYCPESDFTKPPAGALVRQPSMINCHRRKRLLTKVTRSQPENHSSASPPEDTQSAAAPDKNDSLHNASTQNCVEPIESGHSEPLPIVSDAPELAHTASQPLLQPSSPIIPILGDVATMYNLVQFGSGALWTRDFLSTDAP
ncbi:hypothetical protein CRM22_006668 [Opisthorchis felineus]|uniref:C2H2-type domain-containing protein n=1 Tax=Opisthorchis felineus TaxID=147828 RepID=A0A4S2LRC9_OPIFE|nr:hypothetical protein CRM22_006668 [Opisthorchis felineus]